MRDRYSQSLPLLAAILLTALTTACETAPHEVSTALAAREDAFQETLSTYDARNADEQAVIGILEEYRKAYDTSDLSRIEPLLAPNFELRYYRPKSAEQYTVLAQDRSTYLKKRSAWSEHPRHEQLIVNVLDVLLDPLGRGAAVIAATTYKSKYFHPRYVETFGFARTKNGWLLRRILAVPAEPKLKELEVDISLVEIRSHQPGEVSDYSPNEFFEKYIQFFCCLSDERWLQLMVVFAEPPPAGAEIVVTETPVGGAGYVIVTDWGGSGYVITTDLTLRPEHYPPQGSRYFYLVGKGWQGRQHDVKVEVEVNGVIVATKTLR